MRAAPAVILAGRVTPEKGVPRTWMAGGDRFPWGSCSYEKVFRGTSPGMANVVVVGAQWGDEGKGKIVDWLSEQADIVVRFQGGHNAGHTLVINGETYKLALLPSGVLRQHKLSVIGNGVVFDPQAFLDEVEKLKGQGVAISPDNLRVAENVTLILPLHRELDALRESSNSATAIGTDRKST